jgi:hypothetical protein
MVKLVKNTLRTLLTSTSSRDWLAILPQVELAINSTPAQATGHAPLLLALGLTLNVDRRWEPHPRQASLNKEAIIRMARTQDRFTYSRLFRPPRPRRPQLAS